MRLLTLPLPLLLLLAVRPSPAGAQNIVGRVQEALDRAESALGEAFGRSLPLPAASPGVSYSFDPATGNCRRDASTFGQVYLDRADPIGARRLNVSFAYQFVKLDELSGLEADDLRDPSPIPIPGKLAAFEIPRLS